ncbi:amino acid ABC transporter permease [Streptomyces rhizosphaericus]|uniref:Amino acid ABC transporter permease n=1 Tax=Streptomyces rhizosphaericus TaxID=114699 RepID=A0A6G4AE07_9ACTN|nr:amino acid ABC transporter permease [Streptomyces rhizosphaericus]NEW71583.1 amino acid ABC transporter permease [Streptomyces rhizosphaericus]
MTAATDGRAALAPPGGGAEQPRAPKIVPVRHPGRWVAVAIALVLVAQLVHALATNPGLEWATFRQYFFDRSVLHGVWVTIELTFYAALAGFVGGMVLAFMRLSANPLLRVIAYGYVWVVRSVPLLVQVLFWFNISYLYSRLSIGVPFGPEFFSFSTTNLVSSVSAAVIALSVNEAAFASEIVRAGVLSVSHGQLEAAAALGIPRRRQLMRIVLPQAMRTIAPNAANQLISLFKNTSIVSVMAIMELFYTVQVIYGRTSRIVPMLLVATAWYVLLTTLLSIFQYYVERRFAKGTTRALPPTPVERVRLAIRNLRAAAADEGTQR